MSRRRCRTCASPALLIAVASRQRDERRGRRPRSKPRARGLMLLILMHGPTTRFAGLRRPGERPRQGGRTALANWRGGPAHSGMDTRTARPSPSVKRSRQIGASAASFLPHSAHCLHVRAALRMLTLLRLVPLLNLLFPCRPPDGPLRPLATLRRPDARKRACPPEPPRATVSRPPAATVVVAAAQAHHINSHRKRTDRLGCVDQSELTPIARRTIPGVPCGRAPLFLRITLPGMARPAWARRPSPLTTGELPSLDSPRSSRRGWCDVLG